MRSPSCVVAIGASAGGVEALSQVVAGLPRDLPAAVLVVLHIPATGPSALAAILDRNGPLPVRTAHDGDQLEAGLILVAPPDRHLVIKDGAVELSAGPRENGHRPAIDVLFRSAATSFGPHAVAVVLSGMLDDGAAGAAAVSAAGGVVLVQDPADALYGEMPRTVMSRIEIRGHAPAVELGSLIAKNCAAVIDSGAFGEAELSPDDDENERSGVVLGPASGFVCPDCSGTLYVVEDDPILRFRCRVGHAWGAANLLHQQGRSVERSLWVALRTLEEKVELLRRLAERAAAEGRPLTRSKFLDQVDEMAGSAEMIRRLLERGVGSQSAAVPPDVGESAGMAGSG